MPSWPCPADAVTLEGGESLTWYQSSAERPPRLLRHLRRPRAQGNHGCRPRLVSAGLIEGPTASASQEPLGAIEADGNDLPSVTARADPEATPLSNQGQDMTANIDIHAPRRILLVAANPAVSPGHRLAGRLLVVRTHPSLLALPKPATRSTSPAPRARPGGRQLFRSRDASGYSAHDLISLGFKHFAKPCGPPPEHALHRRCVARGL